MIESFKKAINALTVQDRGDAEIRDTIKLRQTRPFVANDQAFIIPKKSVFNRVIGDSQPKHPLPRPGFLDGPRKRRVTFVAQAIWRPSHEVDRSDSH